MLRKLEKYELIEEIGHGGMATVFRARDSRLDRPVALKVMHPHLRKTPEARVRFTREARSVAKLRHPNILEIYDNSEEDSEDAYIVTELLTGPTLKAFIEKHPDVPGEVAACFGIEIARALHAAHEAGIVHRDVKPENVLLHEDRCVKLTDFGIAQMVDAQSFTATGQILGSPGHMAPEQVEGTECDRRSDVFSLGTVLYYLATGRLPFAGRNPHTVLKLIMDCDYPDPLRVRPSIGGDLKAIIDKALARDRDERYQTAADLEQALVEYVKRAGIDDPKKLLSRFLREPEKTAERHRDKLVPRLLKRARRAVADGDVPTAHDAINRVLALDDGNEDALALLDRMGRRDRRRTLVAGSGILLALFGLGSIAFAFLQSGPDGEGDPVAVADPVIMNDTATGDAGGETTDAGAEEDGDAGAAVAAGDDPEDGDDAGQRATPLAVGPVDRPEVARGAGPRRVRFLPEPENVEIGVDGQAPRPFGPSFQSVELEPGTHAFRIRAADDAYLDAEITRTIPPGSTAFPLHLELELAPAGVMVRANVEGTVNVADGLAVGPTRRPLRVPVETVDRDVRSFTVTAPGYRAYTGQVRLTAGEVQGIEVELEEASGSEP